MSSVLSWVYWFVQVLRRIHVVGWAWVMLELPWGCGVGPSQRAGPRDVRRAGVEISIFPSAAALALYLLAAIPLAPLPPPHARAGISEGPNATFRICWGRARGSRGCVQAFSITPCSRSGRPSPEVLVCSADFLAGPQIDIKMTDELSVSLVCFSPPGADGQCRSCWRGRLRRWHGVRCDALGCCSWALPMGTRF